MKKILYCNAGPGLYVVVEDDITKRDGMFIQAKRVFSLEQSPVTQTIRPMRGSMVEMSLSLALYTDVSLSCTFICTLIETSEIHKKITEILAEEERGKKLS